MSRDSVSLLSQVWKVPADKRRDVVLQLARADAFRVVEPTTTTTAAAPPPFDEGPNQIAVRLLRWEKEVNLMRYYGVSGYMREKNFYRLPFLTSRASSSLPSNSTDASASKAITNSTTTELPSESSVQSARVAFMVTTSMRKELVERLNYTPQDIKRLTPVQASLVLQHSVTPSGLESKLPALLQQHAEEQQQKATAAAIEQQRQVEEQRKKEDSLEPPSTTTPQADAMDEQTTSEFHATAEASALGDSTAEFHVADAASARVGETTAEFHAAVAALSSSKETIADFHAAAASSAATVGTTWYELVERQRDESVSVVGLYLHEKEAALGRETYQQLAEKRAERTAVEKKEQVQPVSTFEVRTVVKE